KSPNDCLSTSFQEEAGVPAETTHMGLYAERPQPAIRNQDLLAAWQHRYPLLHRPAMVYS
ncbi:hypothetical protein ILYODFUR_017814, partial [Ilyodon furcidens]